MIFFRQLYLVILHHEVFEAFHVRARVQGTVFSLFQDLVNKVFRYFHVESEYMSTILQQANRLCTR